jgi:hypothetical protein
LLKKKPWALKKYGKAKELNAMQCGIDQFQNVQAAYHDAWFRADTEMLNFLQHPCFFNVRENTVKSKDEFLKIVQQKYKNGMWFSKNSKFQYQAGQVERRDLMASTSGVVRITAIENEVALSVSELWVFVPEVSWKILSFVVHVNAEPLLSPKG